MNRILTHLRHDSSFLKLNTEILLTREAPKVNVIQHRTKYYNNRHRDPQYRRERYRKLWKIDIPDFDQMRKDNKTLSPNEIRSKMKEKGIAPPSTWDERELYAPCTISVIEPYEPKENEKSSSLTDKLKIPFTFGKEKFMKSREVSSVKAYEGEDFSLKDFAESSTGIYVRAHEALVTKDEKKILEYVTEYCFPKMVAGIKNHTMIWKYIGDVEPPMAVQIKSGDMVSKSNKYSQVTVRMHTKQILAVYDRHGRLIHGSPDDVKEVLEYIVFEKYLANEYGSWRIHDRIRPKGVSQTGFSQLVNKTVVLNTSTV